jgi:hypothetical protein
VRGDEEDLDKEEDPDEEVRKPNGRVLEQSINKLL